MAERTLTWIGDVWGWDSWWGYDSDITPTCAARELEDDGQITILLFSSGGDALAGREITNLICNEADRINIKVLGLAASVASIIAISAGKCIMHPGAIS